MSSSAQALVGAGARGHPARTISHPHSACRDGSLPAGENGGAPPEDMSKTQLFSKLVDERERCRVERLKNRQNEIILEQVGGRRRPASLAGTSPQPCCTHAVPEQLGGQPTVFRGKLSGCGESWAVPGL